ncbi:hypothetical protein [Methylobacterium sp. Gmos1]
MSLRLRFLVLTGMLVSAAPSFAEEQTACAPEFWGDGKHDDTAGVIAMAFDKPVRNMSKSASRDKGYWIIRGASIIILRTIYLNTSKRFEVYDSEISVTDEGLIDLTGKRENTNQDGCEAVS